MLARFAGAALALLIVHPGAFPAPPADAIVQPPTNGEVAGSARFVPLPSGTTNRLSPRGVNREGSAVGDSLSILMDSWRVDAVQGVGLRFVPDSGGHRCLAGELGKPGLVAIPAHFDALAAWGRTVYAALEGGGLLEIDARRPDAALVRKQILRSELGERPDPILGLDALGTRLYILTRAGLEILDLSVPPGHRRDIYPGVRGNRIRATGRLLEVTTEEGASIAYRDLSPVPLRFEVAVSNNFFSPQDLNVAVGDEVRWTNVTGMHHNVFSCTTDQVGCAGSASTEPFGSGSPTGFFVYDHTFAQAGSNPYICQPHAPFMIGSVTVTGSAGAPPGVPDGTTGSPMHVQKLVAGGSELSLSWDTTTCPAATNYQILFGYPYSLPPSTGGGYEPAGSRCAIGPTSPFTWNDVPAAFPGPSGWLWWIVVATDGSTTEGSWGRASNGLEREGPGPGGGSMECGIFTKSLVNHCGQ